MGIERQQCAIAKAHVRIGHLKMRAAVRCNMYLAEARSYLENVQSQESNLCREKSFSSSPTHRESSQHRAPSLERPTPKRGGYSGPPPISLR